MKIAIFHNYMDNIGGAERVGLTLAKELNADFYSTNIDNDKIKQLGFNGIKLKSIGKVPINAPFRQQIAMLRFRLLNLKNKYDLFIIDGDWALSGAVKNKPCIWYCHSPIREIWDLYTKTRETLQPPNNWIFDIWVKLNRFLSLRYVKHVQSIIVNGNNVKKRVKKYLGRESIIINPPIHTNEFYHKKHKGFWLSVNRLINHKRVELQIEAFRKMPEETLIIVGCYEKSTHFTKYVNYIRKIKPDNVVLVESLPRKELLEYYATCKGFITTSHDEDFGMTPVEAMAAGKPVVAVNEGGYKETVIHGKTGLLVEANSLKLQQAVKTINKNPEKYKKACQEHAKKFDTELFIAKIKQHISKQIFSPTKNGKKTFKH